GESSRLRQPLRTGGPGGRLPVSQSPGKRTHGRPEPVGNDSPRAWDRLENGSGPPPRRPGRPSQNSSSDKSLRRNDRDKSVKRRVSFGTFRRPIRSGAR